MSGTEPEAATERMSDVEALMWSLEADPMLSSTFANLTFFDRVPEPEALRRRLWRASRAVPRLRRRVVEGFGPGAPVWEDDPDFDLDLHLHWVRLPDEATDADARALAVDLAATPFDSWHRGEPPPRRGPRVCRSPGRDECAGSASPDRRR